MRQRQKSGGNYFFIIFLIMMLVNSFQSGRFNNPRQWLFNTLMVLPAIVIGITLHEFSHAFAAWKLGDSTPKAQGRITLNPLAHIDPLGVIALIFIGFGWGRPVQVNPYAFRKNPRLSNFVVNIAGITTNFIIAILCFPLYLFAPGNILPTLLINIVGINLILMLFNLLPIPPLDGFGIITEIFGLRRFSWYSAFYNNGMMILMVILIIPRFLGFDIIGTLLGSGFYSIMGFFRSFWVTIFIGFL